MRSQSAEDRFFTLGTFMNNVANTKLNLTFTQNVMDPHSNFLANILVTEQICRLREYGRFDGWLLDRGTGTVSTGFELQVGNGQFWECS